MSLAELQRQFQDYVLMGDATIADAIEPSARAPVETRLGVYSNAYRVRLTEALAATYPRVREMMGEEFGDAALDYIATHPSSFRSIRWYGELFAASLELSHRKLPWLADLAQWEWMLAAAFDAPDARPVNEYELAATIAPERWPALTFGFHPSLQRFVCTTNAPELFKALSEELPAPQATQWRTNQHWLIWRQGLTTRFRSLEDLERRALDAALAGAAFGGICEEVCELCGIEEAPLRSASLLRTWVSEGLIVSVQHSF